MKFGVCNFTASKVIGKKPQKGGRHPPSPYRVKFVKLSSFKYEVVIAMPYKTQTNLKD